MEKETLNQTLKRIEEKTNRIFNTPGPRFYFWATEGSQDKRNVERISDFCNTVEGAYKLVELLVRTKEASLYITDRPNLYKLDEDGTTENCARVD